MPSNLSTQMIIGIILCAALVLLYFFKKGPKTLNGFLIVALWCAAIMVVANNWGTTMQLYRMAAPQVQAVLQPALRQIMGGR